MKRPVALLGLFVAAVFVLSACGSAAAPAAQTQTKNQKPSAVVTQAADAVPGTPAHSGGKCDQNTAAPFVPDNSDQAFVLGGGQTLKEIGTKITAMSAKGLDIGVRDFYPNDAPALKTFKGVICPNGDIFKLGDPKAWAHNAWLVNANPKGHKVIPRAGNFTHPAGEILKQPCPAILQQLAGEKYRKIGYFQAVCLDNGDPYDPQYNID